MRDQPQVHPFEAPGSEALDRRGGLVAYATSLVGESHVRRGGVCEDSYLLGPTRHGSGLVAVVADGVGSTGGASRASLSAVLAAHGLLAKLHPGEFGFAPGIPDRHPLTADRWAKFATTVMSATAGHVAHSTRGLPGRPSASTMTFALVWSHPDGVVVAWAGVGDSPAFALLADGTFGWLHEPPERDYTDALPRRRHAVASGVEYLPVGASVLLASDGLGDVLTTELDLAAKMTACLTDGPEDVSRLAELVRTPAPAAYDDRTLVLVADTRRSAGDVPDRTAADDPFDDPGGGAIQ